MLSVPSYFLAYKTQIEAVLHNIIQISSYIFSPLEKLIPWEIFYE